MYLDAGREQQQQGEEEDGAPCEGHAGGGLLPGGSRGSLEVGVTLRSGFVPLRMGHARVFIPKRKGPASEDSVLLLPAQSCWLLLFGLSLL